MEKTRITFNKIIGHTNLILTFVIGILLIRTASIYLHFAKSGSRDLGFIVLFSGMILYY